jgi:hypothetical protein
LDCGFAPHEEEEERCKEVNMFFIWTHESRRCKTSISFLILQNQQRVCHTLAFAIYIEKYLKAKEEFMETQILHHAKI